MKAFLLIGILLVAGLQVTIQGRLNIITQDYSKLWSDLREIARAAAAYNLNQIRNNLDYLQEGHSLLENEQV